MSIFSTKERKTIVKRAAYEPAGVEPRIAFAGNVLVRLLAVRLLLDAGAVLVGHTVALALRFRYGVLAVHGGRGDVTDQAPAALLSAAALMVFIAWNRLYDEDTLFRGGGELARTAKATVQTVVVFSTVAMLTRGFFVSRTWFGMAMLLSGALLIAERVILRSFLGHWRSKGHFRRPVILVSPSPNGSIETEWAGTAADEFEVVDRVIPEAAIALLSRLGNGRRANGIPGVVLRAGEIDDDETWRILLHAGEAGCPVYVQSPMRSVARDRLTVRPVGGRTIVKILPPALTGFQAAQKRILDIVGSGLVLLVGAPVYLLSSLAVVITSGLPIFFGQQRVGRNGKTFKMRKFRTMKRDAEKQTGPVWAAEDDPRRTPLGRILRATSLDEIPQFWNVFVGQMSLVGPRPERPVFVEEFEQTVAWYPYRHRMRPGITGWAQANGLRGNTSLDDRVEYDNWYIEHWSIGLDVKICFLTTLEIFRGRNAY